MGAYATQLEIERQSLEIKKLNLLAAEEINEEKLKELINEQKALAIKAQAYQDSENFARRFLGITRENLR